MPKHRRGIAFRARRHPERSFIPTPAGPATPRLLRNQRDERAVELWRRRTRVANATKIRLGRNRSVDNEVVPARTVKFAASR